MELDFSFGIIATAIAKLFILMLAGYALYHFKLIGDKFVDTLSLVLVRLLFPSLIISKTITHFSFSEYSYWWFLPMCAIIFCIGGMALGWLVLRFFRGFTSPREFMCSCGFQNCGYLPMNLILFAFAGALGDRLLIYMFLFILGFNILMWSLVPLFLTGKLRSQFKISVLLNAPVVATVFSLLWVAIIGKDKMPLVVMDPLRQLGMSSFPIAMITLGAYLYKYRAYHPDFKIPLIWCLATKLFIFPAIIFLVLNFVPLASDYKFFLLLQAIMPTAVSLVVIGSYTNADNKFFSSAIFYSHLIAIFTIPVWLNLFRLVQ